MVWTGFTWVRFGSVTMVAEIQIPLQQISPYQEDSVSYISQSINYIYKDMHYTDE
jgi:hypothetical protein